MVSSDRLGGALRTLGFGTVNFQYEVVRVVFREGGGVALRAPPCKYTDPLVMTTHAFPPLRGTIVCANVKTRGSRTIKL